MIYNIIFVSGVPQNDLTYIHYKMLTMIRIVTVTTQNYYNIFDSISSLQIHIQSEFNIQNIERIHITQHQKIQSEKWADDSN